MYIHIIDVLKKMDWNAKSLTEYTVRKLVLISLKAPLKSFPSRRPIPEIINIGVVKYTWVQLFAGIDFFTIFCDAWSLKLQLLITNDQLIRLQRWICLKQFFYDVLKLPVWRGCV